MFQIYILKMEDSVRKVKEDEDGGIVLCDKCNYYVRSFQDLRRHKTTVHKEVFTEILLDDNGRLCKSERRDTTKAHIHEHGSELNGPSSNMYVGPQMEDNGDISNTVKVEQEDSFSRPAEKDRQRRQCDKCEYTVRFKGGTRDMTRHMTTVHMEVLVLLLIV